jgi:hypothetical protein
MIGSGDAMIGKRFAGERTKAAFHPVSDHRVADLLGNREADTHRHIVVAPRADEQDEAGHGDALAAVGGEEISPFCQRD